MATEHWTLITDPWTLILSRKREGVCTVWRQPPTGGISYEEKPQWVS